MQPAAPADAATPAGRTPPLIVAHRGAWGPAPQNSLQAFERAIALGCGGIEIDVRRTADHRLVIVHDARVMGRLVARQEHRELRERLKQGQAPALEEVLEVAAGRIKLDIELKEDAYVPAVMTAVTRRLQPDEYVVTSFRPAALEAVKRAAPDTTTGLLIGRRLRRRELERRARMTRVDFLAPHFALARRGLLAWAHDHGLPAWVWTVNDPLTMRRLNADPRVAAIITDRPARALRARAAARRVDTADSRQ